MAPEEHLEILRRCIVLARGTMTAENPPFASVLVLDGAVRLEGVNTSTTDKNFLHHAEMNLLWKASQQLSPDELSRAMVYSSTEPCAMCTGAIYWSGIRTIVFGASQESLTKVRRSGLNVSCREVLERETNPFLVVGPLYEEEMMQVHADFYGKSA